MDPPGMDGRRQGGYNLVALAVAITVLNIVVAAAMPMWSTAMKREKEEELIFRGLQYAEGIRLFQRRFGRLPVRLEEMIEVQPRCLRQLWEDPMTESGKWGIIFANAPGQRGRGQNRPGQPGRQGPEGSPPGQTPPARTPPDQSPPGQSPPGQAPGSGVPAPGQEGEETVTVGPITGVRSLSTDDSLLEFNGQTTYDAWQFTIAMVQGSVGIPGQPGGVPNLNVKWVGRPLREGLHAPPGGVPAQLRDNPNAPGNRGPNPGGNPGNRPGNRPGNQPGLNPGTNPGTNPGATGNPERRRNLPNAFGDGRGSGGQRP